MKITELISSLICAITVGASLVHRFLNRSMTETELFIAQWPVFPLLGIAWIVWYVGRKNDTAE